MRKQTKRRSTFGARKLYTFIALLIGGSVLGEILTFPREEEDVSSLLLEEVPLDGLIEKQEHQRRGIQPLETPKQPRSSAEQASTGEGKKPMRILMGGTARDIPPEQIGYIVPKMRRLLQDLTPDWHILVYENDSKRESRNAWKSEFEALGEHGSYVFKDGIGDIADGGRTGRMAYARQEFLRLARKQEADVMIVTDLDGVCGGKDDTLSYNATWFRDMIFTNGHEWEALSALVAEGYWDRWAFRQKDVMPNNMYGKAAGENKIQSPEAMQAWIGEQPPYRFIPVYSAFMMMSIYKVDATAGCKYDHRDTKDDNDCEHVAFHRCMRKQNDARIRIYTANYCDEGC